jgi:hypothetical protein
MPALEPSALVRTLPRIQKPLDVVPLRVGELVLGEQAPRLCRVVVRDRGLEALAQRDRLTQLSSQPPEEADLRRAVGRAAQSSLANMM